MPIIQMLNYPPGHGGRDMDAVGHPQETLVYYFFYRQVSEISDSGDPTQCPRILQPIKRVDILSDDSRIHPIR